MRSLRQIATAMAAIGVVIAASLSGTQAASAAPVEPALESTSAPQAQTITSEQFRAALQGLESSDVPRTTIEADGATFYEYHFPEGDITFPSESTFLKSSETGTAIPDPDVASPMLEVINKGQYTAIGFSRDEQAFLIGGGTAALIGALCLIPGACPVATVVVSGAGAYLSSRGLCPEGQQLWWYDVNGGSTFACRSSAPSLP